MEDQIFFDNKFIFFQEKNKEDFFYGSLVYIVEHNSNGAIGIVVNKLISIDEHQIYKSLGIKNNNNHKSLINGGPVDINKLFIFIFLIFFFKACFYFLSLYIRLFIRAKLFKELKLKILDQTIISRGQPYNENTYVAHPLSGKNVDREAFLKNKNLWILE